MLIITLYNILIKCRGLLFIKLEIDIVFLNANFS